MECLSLMSLSAFVLGSQEDVGPSKVSLGSMFSFSSSVTMLCAYDHELEVGVELGMRLEYAMYFLLSVFTLCTMSFTIRVRT